MDDTAVEPAPWAKLPLFSIVAGVFLLISLTAPLLMITLPVMATIGMSVAAMARRERPRWIAPMVAVLAMLLVLAAGTRLHSIGGTGSANLAAAKIADWSWDVDPSFGTEGTIKWRVAVRNTSNRPIRTVKVDFASYDESGKLLSSTFTLVDAIPPGETRTRESYADLYGREKTAQTVVSEVHFSDE